MPRSQLISADCHFDLPTACRLASAAELIYEEPQAVERTVIGDWQCSQLSFFDVEETQSFVSVTQEAVIVCFRGTEPDRPQDWITDLDFDLTDGPLGGRVHEGFYDALSCVWHSLDQEVHRLQSDRRRKLWVTGHSLGAALATLAVARWRERDLPVTGLYTFGQPRTGDHTFARSFDFVFRPHTFRMVNDLDIVTRTPPRALGYRHVGSFIHINEKGDLEHDICWWRRFLSGWQGAIETILDWGREGVQDHGMTQYRQRIECALQRQNARRPAADHASAATTHPQPARIRPRRRAA
jgi:triacylglycerol lipase